MIENNDFPTTSMFTPKAEYKEGTKDTRLVILKGEIHGCGFNQLGNSCDEIGKSGIAHVLSSAPRYDPYMPNGWMKTPGKFEGDKVQYNAVPTYADLSFSRCSTNYKDACHSLDANNYGRYFWTGVKTSHPGHAYSKYGSNDQFTLLEDVEINGYNFHTGNPCPPNDTKNTGETPPAQRRCTSCCNVFFCKQDNCLKGSGHWNCEHGEHQYLCSKYITKSCESIGLINSETATVAEYDAGGKWYSGTRPNEPLKTADSRFSGEGSYGFAKCEYPTYALQNKNDVVDLYEKINAGKVPGNMAFVAPLMEKFCTRIRDNTKQDKCVGNFLTTIYAKDNDAMDPYPSECSNFFANDESGSLCRGWLDTMRNTPDGTTMRRYDDIIRDHCANNPTLDECKCVNRSSDPIWSDIRRFGGGGDGSDHCWYLPCTQIDGMLLNKHLYEMVTKTADCGDVCKNVLTVVDSHYNELPPGFEQNMKCLNSSPSSGTTTSPPLGGENPNVDDNDDDGFFGEDNKTLVVGVAGAMAVLFLVMGAIAMQTSFDTTSSRSKIKVANDKGIFGHLFSEEGAKPTTPVKKKKKTKKVV